MSRSLVDDAFAHHVWATWRLIDACMDLTPQQLNTPVPGTYGSILQTMRHLVQADTYYLSHLVGGQQADTDQMDLRGLRKVIEADQKTWTELLAGGLDPEAVVEDVDEAGYVREATIGLRLAQALQHGNDHRSQICTALTSFGLEPPDIDVWAFGYESGRAVDHPPVKVAEKKIP